VCSFSKEGEQEDVSLCGFAFANGEVGEEQSFASSMSAIAIFQQLGNGQRQVVYSAPSGKELYARTEQILGLRRRETYL